MVAMLVIRDLGVSTALGRNSPDLEVPDPARILVMGFGLDWGLEESWATFSGIRIGKYVFDVLVYVPSLWIMMNSDKVNMQVD